jgi:uncharacterized protein with gpF-like domain
MTWQEINNKRLPFIRMGERLFRGMYSEIRKDYIASLQNLTTPEEIIQASHDLKIDETKVQAAFERFYLKTGMAFAKWITKDGNPSIERKQADMWEEKIIEYVRSNAGLKITKTIRTHYEDIERITKTAVEEGIKEGWGMDKIARAIQSSESEMDLWKALRIARTEVVAASNEGVKVGAEDLPGNKEKVWISTFDERSRGAKPTDTHDHMAMDGVRVPFNEDFITPNGNKLEFPGDPKCSDPGEIINCRCGYDIVVSSEYF